VCGIRRCAHCTGDLVSVIASRLGTFALASWHQQAGYAALAIVLLRLLWGGIGSPYARFRQFIRGPRATWTYLLAVLQRREPRHFGHNPLGACMVLALLACVGALGMTGWLYTTDMFWGDASVALAHLALAWGLPALVIVHIAGVLFTSHRQDENLITAMVPATRPSASPTCPRGAAIRRPENVGYGAPVLRRARSIAWRASNSASSDRSSGERQRPACW